ncbi:sterol desaturase family protein [Pelobium sp.]|nr:sterol desaturase family protein [Pelobium sp.]MDA9555687.1 sterol desaturase family protein [Pelobium sp.]
MNTQPANFNHASTQQVLFYAVVIVLLWHTELFLKGEGLKQKWKHTVFNIGFIITALCVQLPITVFVLKAIAWTGIHHWGIFYFLPFHQHFIWRAIVGLILLDFTEYLYHVAMHKFSYCWLFHLIHHTDTKLDVSTTVREHPIETFIRVTYLILVVLVTGVPIGVLMIRQFLQSLSNVASHTSISLSHRIESVLRWVFITPDLHKVHHHHELPYTDCNYGDILCVWDRLFGTYQELNPSEIKYGLDTAHPEKINSFKELITYPFYHKVSKNK